jgi:hypothetical protein
MLTIEDVFHRESLAIEVDTSLPGVRVARVLDRRPRNGALSRASLCSTTVRN